MVVLQHKSVIPTSDICKSMNMILWMIEGPFEDPKSKNEVFLFIIIVCVEKKLM